MFKRSLGIFALLTASLTIATSVQQSTAYNTGELGVGPSQSFLSSSATPALWNFEVPINSSTTSSLSSGLIFFAPRGTATEQSGALIFSQTGELVWDAAEFGYTQTMQFEVQTYQGEQVLTMWQGTFDAAGYGSGWNLILNESYEVIANVTANLNGTLADLHEFHITSNSTAMLTAYQPVSYDLTAYTIEDGTILDCIAQDVNITTGESIFTWSALDHVSPGVCYASPGTTGGVGEEPWDYFHMNSIDKDDSGNYLISSRHCKALYYVSGATGDIIWTLGGMNSTFSMGNGTTFEFQHHARFHGENNAQISVFDNAATNWESDESYARGLLLDLDYTNMSAALAVECIPYNQTVSESQGSIQVQDNGNFLVGWGQTPWFAEYDSTGALLWTVQYGYGDVQGYRVFRDSWTATPQTDPSLFINFTVAAVSWNGATKVAYWSLYSSNDTTTTTLIGNTTKMGFETVITLASDATALYYQAAALNTAGEVLGWSDFISINGNASSPTTKEVAQISNATTTASTTATGTAVPLASAASATSGGTAEIACGHLMGSLLLAIGCLAML